MTTAKATTNAVLNGTVTVYTTKFDENWTKLLTKITPPQSTANWGSGPKPTKIVDLLRVEKRITIDGFIASSDKDNLKNLVAQGGVISLDYNGEALRYINIDKLLISDNNREEQDETMVTITAVVGEDI